MFFPRFFFVPVIAVVVRHIRFQDSIVIVSPPPPAPAPHCYTRLSDVVRFPHEPRGSYSTFVTFLQHLHVFSRCFASTLFVYPSYYRLLHALYYSFAIIFPPPPPYFSFLFRTTN